MLSFLITRDEKDVVTGGCVLQLLKQPGMVSNIVAQGRIVAALPTNDGRERFVGYGIGNTGNKVVSKEQLSAKWLELGANDNSVDPTSCSNMSTAIGIAAITKTSMKVMKSQRNIP